MTLTSQSRAIDPGAYSEYLRTVPGRLRIDLAWENLRGFLPTLPGTTVLDIGGGTGEMALRLAAFGLQVTVLDSSEAMLGEIERAAAAEASRRRRITLVHGDARHLTQLFTPASFMVIVCHNILEFVDSPTTILQSIASLLTRSETAFASVIVRNRAGEVLSAALKNGDLAAAEKNLTTPKVTAKLADLPVSVFTPQELRAMLSLAGLKTLAEYGIRVCSDYLPQTSVAGDSNYAALLALERKLGAQQDFAAIARYTQVIARRGRADNDEPRPDQ